MASAFLAMTYLTLPLESQEVAPEEICCFTKRTQNLEYRYIAFRNIASNIGRCDGIYEIPTGRIFLSCSSRRFLIWLPCNQSGSKGTILELTNSFENPFGDENLMCIAMDARDVISKSVVLESYEINGDWKLVFDEDEKRWNVTVDFADLSTISAKIVGSDLSQELVYEKSPFEKSIRIDMPMVDLLVDSNEAFVRGFKLAIKRRNEFDKSSIIRKGIESFKPHPSGEGSTKSSRSDSQPVGLIDRSLRVSFLFDF
jgi:hypothetical protein